MVVSTNTNRIQETPDFWPVDLPIIMWYRSQLSAKDEENIFNILKTPARICEIDVDKTYYLSEEYAPLLEQSFPALEYLRLGSQGTTANGGALVFTDSFLRNSPSRLFDIGLQDTFFPSLPRLLSTSPNLVTLQLENIPAGGISTAQELAVGLSSATQLKSLKIGIRGGPFPHPSRENDLEPRSVLPTLLEFEYEGETPFLNDFASRIDTPIIEQINVKLFGDHYEEYDTDGLCGLLARVEELGPSHRHTTYIRFFDDHHVKEFVVFEHHFIRSTTSSPVSFRLELLDPSRLHDNTVFVNHICFGFLSAGIMHKVTRVEIDGSSASSLWYTEEDWLSFLLYLPNVKRLHVAGPLALSLVSALVDASEEETVALTMVTLLPALRVLHLPEGFGASVDSLPEWFGTSVDIEPFVAARRSYGLPLSVHYKGLRLDWRDDQDDDCSDGSDE